MRWAWHIGSLFGIKFYMHYTFPLLLVGMGLYNLSNGRSMQETLLWLSLVVALFVIVVLHELGHALAARHYGIPTRDITLLPIGGVARIERMPEEPLQEIVVALAGPAVNGVLALVLSLGLLALRHTLGAGTLPPLAEEWLVDLIWLNLAMLIFNLLPAFPMDGGRVLRALLAYNVGLERGTTIAAWTARGLALVMIAVALFISAPMLALVAFFVWYGGSMELAAVRWRARLGDLSVRQVMLERFQALLPENTLGQARALCDRLEGQQDFPVVRDGAVVGVLTRGRLEAGLLAAGESTPVGAAMSTLFPVVDPDETLGAVLARLHDRQFVTLPVVVQNQLCGVLALDQITERLRRATAG